MNELNTKLSQIYHVIVTKTPNKTSFPVFSSSILSAIRCERCNIIQKLCNTYSLKAPELCIVAKVQNKNVIYRKLQR